MYAFGSLWSLCTVVGILIGHKLLVASCSGTSFQINEAGTDLFLIIILLQETTFGSVSGKSPVSPSDQKPPSLQGKCVRSQAWQCGMVNSAASTCVQLCEASSVQGQADVALCVTFLLQTGYVLHPLWAASSALCLQPALKWVKNYFIAVGYCIITRGLQEFPGPTFGSACFFCSVL